MRDDKASINHSSLQAIRPDAGQANQNELKTHLISRNITVHGHRTSIRLEPEMWTGFADISRREGLTIHELATQIAGKIVPHQSLTSAIRVFIMAYFRASSTEEGHAKAGHPSHKVGY